MADFYSCAVNVSYTCDNENNMEVEVTYEDSEGVETGAYAAGNDITTLISDITNQLEENVANAGDEKADQDEKEMLYNRIAELEAENKQLREKANSKEKKLDKATIHDTEEYLNKFFDKKYSDIMNKFKGTFPQDPYTSFLISNK